MIFGYSDSVNFISDLIHNSSLGSGYITCEPETYSSWFSYCFNPEDATIHFNPSATPPDEVAERQNKGWLAK